MKEDRAFLPRNVSVASPPEPYWLIDASSPPFPRALLSIDTVLEELPLVPHLILTLQMRLIVPFKMSPGVSGKIKMPMCGSSLRVPLTAWNAVVSDSLVSSGVPALR